MTLQPNRLTVGDLFFDCRGIERYPFFHNGETKPACLFEDYDDPWEPLAKLSDLLKSVTSLDPVRVVKSKKNLLVEPNPKCSYPCVQTEYKCPPPYPTMDSRVLLLRGGEGLTADDSAKLKGPAYIGTRVQMRHGSGILGSVVIGDGETYNEELEAHKELGAGGILGYSVTVRRSIVRSGCKICSGTELADCIIGRNVQIGPGTQIAHENFSHRPVNFPRWNGGEDYEFLPWESGLVKLGAIVGDNCLIGANVTLKPGVILTPGSVVHGGQTLEAGIYTPEYFQ